MRLGVQLHVRAKHPTSDDYTVNQEALFLNVAGTARNSKSDDAVIHCLERNALLAASITANGGIAPTNENVVVGHGNFLSMKNCSWHAALVQSLVPWVCWMEHVQR